MAGIAQARMYVRVAKIMIAAGAGPLIRPLAESMNKHITKRVVIVLFIFASNKTEVRVRQVKEIIHQFIPVIGSIYRPFFTIIPFDGSWFLTSASASSEVSRHAHHALQLKIT
jgi:hypothetical protein